MLDLPVFRLGKENFSEESKEVIAFVNAPNDLETLCDHVENLHGGAGVHHDVIDFHFGYESLLLIEIFNFIHV